ncbi:alpha-L-fucosidase [Gleimia coleocanis]|nr:alpha-L-fucosidase [Gleimia coleocanis]
MFTFENRVGPVELAAKANYPKREIPEWFKDAKLGFFIHYGLYSVPAWAYQPDGSKYGLEEAYTYHQYAEWYGNTWRINGSPCRKFHEDSYGVGTTYEDFTKLFAPSVENLQATVQLLIDAGAKYIVPTTKHHDGFCLWETDSTDFNCVKRANGVDVVQVITETARAGGAEVGIYFSGALDWHVSDFPPIESDRDIFIYRRNDPAYAKYAANQLEELIEKFAPKLLWNDIDWPDAGKGDDEFSLSKLFERYFASQPEGIINDRWGIPYHEYLTREYTDVSETMFKPWESTRGIAKSFGVNNNESGADFLTIKGLINYFVDVVSKGGNLLLNVGPNADGSLEERQAIIVRGLGAWMAHYGKFIYGSRPWQRFTDEQEANPRYLTLPASHPSPGLAVIICNPNATSYTVPADFPATTATWYVEGNRFEVEVHPGAQLPLPQVESDLPYVLYIPTI